MTTGRITVRARWCYLVVAGICLVNSGCVAAAVGAAGAGGAALYAHYQGTDSNTFDADVNAMEHATEDALYDLAMPVVKETHGSSNSLTIKSTTGTGDSVTIEIEPEPQKIPSDPVRSKVSVRVAMFGDHDVGMRILHRIDARVASGGGTRIPAVATPGAPNQSQPATAGADPVTPVSANGSAAAPGATNQNQPAPAGVVTNAVMPVSTNGAVGTSPVVPAVPPDPTPPPATPNGNWRPAGK